MNNYLLECYDHLLIQKEIEKIIEKENYQEAFLSSYDMDEVPLSNALEDLDTYSFLSDKKVIIIKNILSKLITEEEMNHLFKYLDNFNSDYLLIITADSLDSKKISKKLKEHKNISYLKLSINSTDYIKNKLKDYKIDISTIKMLEDLCKDDITKIDSECNKLMIYCTNKKEITKEDVLNLVVKKLGESSDVLFSLVNYIMKKDKKHALEKYEELKEYNVDSNSILGLMASQMKLVTQIKILKEENMKNVDIQKTLGLKSIYHINKLSEYTYQYTYKDLMEFMNLVQDTDYRIKSGRLDSSLAIELLILNL